MSSHSVTAISNEELQRLADLAQLRLPDGEARQQLAEQLSKIVTYVSSVQEYEPTAGMQNSAAIMVPRPDVPQADVIGTIGSNNRPQWLDQSPLVEGQLVVVPGLFNNNGTSAK